MTNSDDILRIDTPENVTFDYDVAGIGSRFLAALVDTILMFLLQVIIFGTLILLGFQLGDFVSGSIPSWVAAIFSLMAFIFFWGYYIFFELLWNGQTPGKRWVGLRAIGVDGMPVTAIGVVIRNLVRIIDFMPVAYGVGVITMFVNEKSRRLGDLAAGTVVVHDRSVSTLAELGQQSNSLDTVQAHVPVPENFPLGRLKENDIEIVETYLQRRYSLPNREELASQILNSLYARLDLPAPSSQTDSADNVLAAIYKAVKVHKSE